MSKKTEPQVVGLKKLSHQAASQAISRLHYKIREVNKLLTEVEELRKNPDPKFPSALSIKEWDLVESRKKLEQEYNKSGNSVRSVVEKDYVKAIKEVEEVFNEQGMGNTTA